MRDREILGKDGFVLTIIQRNKKTHTILDQPQIISRGFVYLRESEWLIEGMRTKIDHLVQTSNGTNPNDLSKHIQDSLSKYLYDETKRRPMVFAHVTDT